MCYCAFRSQNHYRASVAARRARRAHHRPHTTPTSPPTCSHQTNHPNRPNPAAAAGVLLGALALLLAAAATATALLLTRGQDELPPPPPPPVEPEPPPPVRGVSLLAVQTPTTAGTYTLSWQTLYDCDPGDLGGAGAATSGASGSVTMSVVDDNVPLNGEGDPVETSIVINEICNYDFSADFVNVAGFRIARSPTRVWRSTTRSPSQSRRIAVRRL